MCILLITITFIRIIIPYSSFFLFPLKHSQMHGTDINLYKAVLQTHKSIVQSPIWLSCNYSGLPAKHYQGQDFSHPCHCQLPILNVPLPMGGTLQCWYRASLVGGMDSYGKADEAMQKDLYLA